MSAKVLVLPIFLLIGYSAVAQWSLQDSPTQSPINDIHFTSATVGFIASGNVVHRTVNGGTSWAQPSFTGSAIELEILINALIYDIYFVDSQKGFMVGGGFFNTYDIIARTLDGGATWSLVYYTPVQGSFIRESMNSITFVNSTTGFAVGGKGRVVKTTDGGATWTDTSLSTTKDLNIVYFQDAQTGFIGGKDVLFKTSNGGSTWSTQNLAYDINDFHFYNATSGIASTTSGALLKTTDGGNSWTEDPLLTFDYPLTKIEFASGTGYILANNASYQTFILRSSDNGSTWQRQDFPVGYGMYGLYAASANTVWAGGYAGKLYKTTNGGGPVSPIASFSVSAPNLCENQTYTFQNHGYQNYAYEWRVDGVLKSTFYNFSSTFTQGEHTIELTAINGAQRGTTSMVQYVEADAAFREPIEVTFTDGICVGSKTMIRVYENEWGNYKLYLNGEEITGTENFPYHYFQTPALTQTTTFTVKATRSNSCAAFEKTKDVIVTVHPFPTTGSGVSALQPDLCNEGQTAIRISNSKPNVRYDLYYTKNDWQPITSVTGNGGNALLATPLLRDSTKYLVKASVINGACGSWFEDTVRVNVEKVVASFALSLVNTPSGDPVTVTNNSLGATNFSWNFSSASSPQTSTATQPGTVTFIGAGAHTVSLSVSSASGCSDSAEKSITIYDPAILDPSCWAAEIAYPEDFFSSREEHIDIETAPNDDLLLTGAHVPMSFQSESLGKFQLPGNNASNEFLARYSPEGVLKWMIPNTGIGSPSSGRLAVSADGSIYMHGSAFENPTFYSVDGTSIKKSVSDNLSSKYFVLKYSATGKLIWAKSFEELHIPIEWHYVYAIETDGEGNVYVANDQVTKISPAGQHLWTSDKLLFVHEQDYEKGRFTVAGDGSWYFLKRNQPLELSHFSKDGVLMWRHNISYSGFGDLPAETRLGADDAGNLIFMYSDVWKTVLQLPDPTINTDPSSLWVIKFAPDGSIIWANKSHNLMICNDFEVSRNGNINLLLNLYTWQLPDLKTSLQSQDGVDIQLDFAGNTPQLVTYNTNGVTLRSRPIRDPAGQGECVMFNTDLAAYNDGVYAIGFPNCESIINGDIIYGNWGTPGETIMYLAKFDLGCNNIPQKFDVSITDNMQDQYCAGSTIQVNYLISGPVGGTNLFKVYLSDEWGYTARDRSTLIGTLESSSPSGTIQVVVPNDVVWGVPYYIRVVVDSDPELYSTIIPVNKYLSGDFTPDYDLYLNDLNLTLTAKGRTGVHYEWIIKHYQTGETVTISGDAQEAMSIIHRVPETGNYTVYLTVTDECGNTGTIEKGLIYIPCANYPIQDFTYSIDKKTVTFTASVDATRTNTYAWDFRDGNTSTEKNPVHTFTTYGTKSVEFIVTNECGGGASWKTVELPCPVLDPKISYSQPPNQKTVTFTHSGTSALPGISTYLWTFGDGTTSTEMNPEHTYTSFGNYNVSLTETNECDSKTVWITAAITCPNPVPDFTSSVQNLKVLLTNTSQNFSSLSWDFGDGTSSSAVSPVEHTYPTPGTYVVILTVTNSCGSVQILKPIPVTCPKPSLTFSSTSVNLTASFTSSFQNATSVHWNFGDGTTTETSGSTINHAYTTTGIYQVCMSATNECGTEQVCQSIEIVCPIPVAAFTYEATSGLSVSFVSSSENHTALLWSFGDGEQSTDATVIHEFEPGIYEVCLEAESVCGSETTCEQVTVVITGREAELSKTVLMYPNPVSDNLLIRTEQIPIDRIEAITALGVKVYTERFDSPKNEVKINTHGWSRGEYVILISTGSGNLTRKIVKK